MIILALHGLVLGGTFGIGVVWGFIIRFEARHRWHVGLRVYGPTCLLNFVDYAQRNVVLYKAVAVSQRDLIPHIEYSWVGQGALFNNRATGVTIEYHSPLTSNISSEPLTPYVGMQCAICLTTWPHLKSS